jgi:pSer/pThr/pTyr-binding forkhead associated (FHA) protein
VPNLSVPPHPEYVERAVLEFDGPPGRVPIRLGEVIIGRHSSDDVRVPDVRISRHHARLVARTDGGFEIHNLTAVRSEPNPMEVNGVALEHADVDDGDIITLGGVSFRFRSAKG